MAGSSALLEVVSGKAAGMSIVVDDELVVGRNAEGAGKLAEDGELSRSHARIAIDGNGFCAVEDLGSTNGTFVNGLRITSPQTLSPGDTIEVGGTTLVVRDLPTVGAQDTAPSVIMPLSPPPPAEEVAQPSAPASSAEPESSSAAPESPSAPEQPSAPEPAGASESPSIPAAPAAASGSLSLELEVDFSAQEVRLRMGDGGEPVRLVCEDGVWRAAQDAATRERDSA